MFHLKRGNINKEWKRAKIHNYLLSFYHASIYPPSHYFRWKMVFNAFEAHPSWGWRCLYCMSFCLLGILTLKHILGSHLSQFYRAGKEKTTFCSENTFSHLAKWLSGLYCGSLSKNRMKTNCYHLRKPMTIMINEQIFLPSEVIA